METTGLVNTRIAEFENMAEKNGLMVKETLVPTGTVCSLIRFFETEVAAENSEVQLSFINSDMGNEGVNELIPFGEYPSFRTAQSRFEEPSEVEETVRPEKDLAPSVCSVDSSNEVEETVRREEDLAPSVCGADSSSEVDTEIQPNILPTSAISQDDITPEEDNPFIFHINAPATNIAQAKKDALKRSQKRRSPIRRLMANGLKVFKKQKPKTNSKTTYVDTCKEGSKISRQEFLTEEREESRAEKVGQHASTQKGKQGFELFGRMKRAHGKKASDSLLSKLKWLLPRRPSRQGDVMQKKTASPKSRNPKTHPRSLPFPIEMDIPVPTEELTFKEVNIGNVRLTIAAAATIEDSSSES